MWEMLSAISRLTMISMTHANLNSTHITCVSMYAMLPLHWSIHFICIVVFQNVISMSTWFWNLVSCVEMAGRNDIMSLCPCFPVSLSCFSSSPLVPPRPHWRCWRLKWTSWFRRGWIRLKRSNEQKSSAKWVNMHIRQISHIRNVLVNYAVYFVTYICALVSSSMLILEYD